MKIRLKINQKLKAFTLLESLVSMVILLCVFGSAILVFTNQLKGNNFIKSMNAQSVLDQVASEEQKLKEHTSETINRNDLIIEKQYTLLPENSKLLQLHLKAINKEGKQVLAEKKLLIPIL